MYLYIEFDAYTTVDSVNTSSICPLLIHDQPLWCERNQPRVFTRQLRLMAMHVNVPDTYIPPPANDLTNMFRQYAQLDHDNYIPYAALAYNRKIGDIMFITNLYVFFILYILVVFVMIQIYTQSSHKDKE